MILRAVLKALVLPPMLNILLIILGLVVWRYHKKLGKGLVVFSIVLLWALSAPLFSQALMATLENKYKPLNMEELKKSYQDKNANKIEAQKRTAIVVLGGGRYRSAPEYGGKDTVSVMSLNRLRYTAMLSKELGLPVLTAGGSVFARFTEESVSESQLMQEVLENNFGVTVKWKENASKTTADNARNSVYILRDTNIDSIILVTHANHMPRAVSSFEKEIEFLGKDISIIPAPMGFLSIDDAPNFIVGLIPKSAALQTSRVALHEWLGRFYYAVSN
ncbi:MAG: YdcF family protein [Cellvibrionaceae bacterium]